MDDLSEIYLCYSQPIKGTRRVNLPESRSFNKRKKEVFAWAKNSGVTPLSNFFSFDVEQLLSSGQFVEQDILELEFTEEWHDPSELEITVTSLLETGRKAVNKLPTVKYFVVFLEALLLAAREAITQDCEVHLSSLD